MSPLGRNFYLNITPNNLVHLYLRRDAVGDGSPTSVRIRELSSKDWETTVPTTTESVCSSGRTPVTNYVNGRISDDCAARETPNESLMTNPRQKQSLSELVSSLRNCNSATTTQAPSRVGLSVPRTFENASTQSSVPQSLHGSLSEQNSLHNIRTTSSDRSEISDSNPTCSSRLAASSQTSDVPAESRCLQTPSQINGAKFRFKRTPTTPVLSQVQPSVDEQKTTAVDRHHSAASAASASRSRPGSLVSASVGCTPAAVGQTAVADMWDAGKQSFAGATVYTLLPTLSSGNRFMYLFIYLFIYLFTVYNKHKQKYRLGPPCCLCLPYMSQKYFLSTWYCRDIVIFIGLL